MTIAYLTPEYPHPRIGNSGGLGTSIKNLAEALVAAGQNVCIIVSGRATDFSFEENGIRFYGIAQRRSPFFTWYTYRRYLNRRINALVKTEQIDLIEAPDWTGLTAFMRFKVPLVIRFNGSDTYFCHLENRPQKWKNRWFERLALKNADALVSVSAFTADTTRKLFKLKQDIRVIPNSVDIARFTPKPEQQLPYRVLYFGTLIRKKGVLELPAVFNRVHAELPQVEFVLAGKDVVDVLTNQSTYHLMLGAMNPSTRKQTHFLGALPYEAVKDEIAKATVVVLPSFAEALPMTWLEALAMEKALITSDIGWAKEVMIHGETGYMVAPKDHIAFAGYILDFLKDADLRTSMGARGREHVKANFSSEDITARNLTYYQSVLKSALR